MLVASAGGEVRGNCGLPAWLPPHVTDTSNEGSCTPLGQLLLQLTMTLRRQAWQCPPLQALLQARQTVLLRQKWPPYCLDMST
jgi:hypothetical protein